ncbi:MAG: Rid family detoxifying hydrolase [Acidobacteriota bacterium]|nr:Rid family detoxifying hydrolase [Acidobacteriota bacterium]
MEPTPSTCSTRSSRRSASPSRERAPRKGQSVADKTVVRTEAAPAPFQGAPYSQAIRSGGFVFVSGQLALKAGDKDLTGGTIEEQTEQALANLRAILEEAGSGLDKLVKTTVFLQNLDDFQGMNAVYAKHVGDTPPARSTVEVAKLPSGALVEIEAIAAL